MASDDVDMRLAVTLSPTTQALMRLVTTVRGRGSEILRLQWDISEASSALAVLDLACAPGRQEHLQAVLARIIDVREVTRLDLARQSDCGVGCP